MIILKLNTLTIEKKKEYKVLEGVLYVDNEPIEIIGDDIVTWDVSSLEDFSSIERKEEGNIIMSINIFTDNNTKNSFFSIIKKPENGKLKIEDAGFPYTVKNNAVIWEAPLEKLEGMSW